MIDDLFVRLVFYFILSVSKECRFLLLKKGFRGFKICMLKFVVKEM